MRIPFCYRAGTVLLGVLALLGDSACSFSFGSDKTTDWPLFRGNALQNGVAGSALPDKLEILWQFKTKDAIEGAAAIAGDSVFVGCNDEHLYALDLATGKEKWRFKAGPIKAPPSVRGDAVYVGDQEGVFHCVDRASGKKRWTFDAGGAEIVSGANFTNDSVIFGSYDETLYCLTLDGKPRWKFKIAGPVNGSPAVAGDDSILHILDTATGKELGSVELGGQAGATAAVFGDHLYVGTMSNQMLGINWKKGEIEWSFEAPARRQAFYASAAVTDKLVVVGSRDKRVWALDRKTGKEVWSFLTEGRVDASPVVSGTRVLAPSLDGHFYILDLTTGKELNRLKLGSGIAASPAVAGHRLVIGTNDGVVYCLGSR